MKRAFITGITGQDGSYMAELLLSKGYEVAGLARKVSGGSNTVRIQHLLNKKYFSLFQGDITDYNRLRKVINNFRPDEIYNFAAQSHISNSFEFPEETCKVNSLGCLNLLNIIRDECNGTKFFQASTGEFFGSNVNRPRVEEDMMHMNSPYAYSKLMAYWATVNHREVFNIFACNGIMFPHESPRRGENFVTQKIIKGIVDISERKQDCIELGNIYTRKDWGYAPEYVEAAWLMLQKRKSNDYIIATGEEHSIKEFVEEAFSHIKINLQWEGTGINEVGKDNDKILVKINPIFYRDNEVKSLVGNYSKANKAFGFEPKVKFKELVKMMMKSEIEKRI